MDEIETKRKRKAIGWRNGFGQAGAIFAWSLVAASAANIGLGPLLIGIGVATLLLAALSRFRYSIIAAPSFIFIPALLIFARGYETLQIGTPAWLFRLGGLLVSLWISGLLYIILATLVRYVGLKKMRKIFSPIYSGVIIVLLALTSLPRIFMYTYYEPLLAMPEQTYKFAIIGIISFIGYLGATSLSKKAGSQPLTSGLVGIASGLAATLILDGIEVLFLSKLLSQTLLLKSFEVSMFAAVPLTVFHDLEGTFGFWQYLHFDWESLLLFTPLALIAVSEHIRAMTKYVINNQEGDQSAQADKTILSEGVSILVGGMACGYPLTINEETVAIATSSKKAHPILLGAIAVVFIGLGIFTPFGHVFSLIPLPVFGGVLIGWAGYQAISGFSRFSLLIHDQLHPQASALAMLLLGFGMLLGLLEFISDFLGNDMFRLVIGTTPIPSYLIMIVTAFIMNLMFPRLVE